MNWDMCAHFTETLRRLGFTSSSTFASQLRDLNVEIIEWKRLDKKYGSSQEKM